MNILFDLDGTLTDSGPGITRCLQHALTRLGRPAPAASALRRFVGPPLHETFAELLETRDAALVDGAGRGRTVWYVVLPLALPGLIAAGIFTFILAWNDFLFALVLITSEELKTLPVGVNDLFNATIVDWGMIMAAGVMITVPTVAFFVAIQRYLIQGWGAGGVKG